MLSISIRWENISSEAACTGLEFLLPPAPSDHPAHSQGVRILDNWNKHPAVHSAWLPAFPKVLRCTTGSCGHPMPATCSRGWWKRPHTVGLAGEYLQRHAGLFQKSAYCSSCFKIDSILEIMVSTACEYHAHMEGTGTFIGLFYF